MTSQRHTKILATLGPSTETVEQIENLILAGADGFRLNFSHGTHQWHKSIYERVRAAAARSGRAIAIVQDLQGKKIRLGEIENNGINLLVGASLTITTQSIIGSQSRIPTTCADLPQDVSAGSRILLNDGRIQLIVEQVLGTEINCRVVTGGFISSRKGIHVPGAISGPAPLSEKDQADAELGLSLGVDFLALSFVTQASEINFLREWMSKKGKVIPIIAKIETAQAIENLDEIISAADGVMVARGDLGVEVSLEMIPFYQKKIIRQANAVGKLVITATQMLESMIEKPSPTRAEVTDIANSIIDGTDVVMLSGETAIGRFPIETINQMSSIAETAEQTVYSYGPRKPDSSKKEILDFPTVAARLIGEASQALDPRAIVAFTRTGSTAKLISSERPRAPIFAFTPEPSIYQHLALYWGVVPKIFTESPRTHETARELTRRLLKEHVVEKKDAILFLQSAGNTNVIRIAFAGEAAQEN